MYINLYWSVATNRVESGANAKAVRYVLHDVTLVKAPVALSVLIY